MKKYCAVLLAGMLCLSASCSWAMNVRFHAYEDMCYVGADGDIAVMMIEGAGGEGNFSISGTLPPGCRLKHDSGSKIANISGTPTTAGTYTFRINATVVYTVGGVRIDPVTGFPHGNPTLNTDSGSTSATITIRPSGSGNGGSGESGTGSNGSPADEDSGSDGSPSNDSTGSGGSNSGSVGSSGGGCSYGLGAVSFAVLGLAFTLRHKH